MSADGSVVDLEMARIEREDDNTKVTPEELIRYVLKQLQDGSVGGKDNPGAKPVAAFACIIAKNPNGTITYDKFRCGMSRVEEVGYVETYKLQIQDRWRNV